MVFETAQTNPWQNFDFVSNIFSDCRTRDDDPGLHEAEAGFIRLIDKLTNGSKVGFSWQNFVLTML